MSNERRFGVEIEFCSSDGIYDWSEWLSNTTGIEVEPYFGAPGAWKLVEDGSVDGWELVSPVLHGKSGMEQVAKMVDALKKHGATMEISCGFHVHVDAGDFSFANIVEAIKRYDRHEHAIDMVVARHRRGSNNIYAEPMSWHISKILDFAKNKQQLRESIEKEEIERYTKLNICAYVKHGTLEFRQHEGTLDLQKILDWIEFCVKFMNDVRENKPFSRPKTKKPLRVYESVAKLFLAEHGWVKKEKIAESLGVSVNSVSSYVSRFRKKYPEDPVFAKCGFYKLDRTDRLQRSLQRTA